MSVTITKLVPSPYVLLNGFQKASMFAVSYARPFKAWYRVTMGDRKPYVRYLGITAFGKNKFEILLPDTHSELKPGETISLKVEIFDNDKCAGAVRAVFYDATFARTRHWEFFYSQTMHTDLGYTDYQEDLRPLFSSFLDTVKQYMKNSDSRESDLQKYRYAIESGWVMGEGYMTQRNADEIGEIQDLIGQGRMTIGAGRFNYTTECFSTEETARAAYYTNRYLVDKLGIEPSTTQRMFDNPAFTKSYVDIAASAGIKYGIHSMNPDRSPYHKKKQYDLFYMDGMNSQNKLLIFNGKTYGDNYGFGGNHNCPEFGSAAIAQKALLGIIGELEGRKGRRSYPYDKFPLPLIPYGDNKQPMEMPVETANEINRVWERQGYCYPRITVDFPEAFFEQVEKEYGHMIPHEHGTEENWWNDGWGTTAYESGINKKAGALIPIAETASAISSLLFAQPYPCEEISEAVERNLTYDEHTWGYHSYTGDEMYHDQFEWKRSNALGAMALAGKLLDRSLETLASHTACDSAAFYVYNSLNWTRSDLVKIKQTKDLPAFFELLDGERSVPYYIDDGMVLFTACDIPANGYKIFAIRQLDQKPQFETACIRCNNGMENAFYKVIFSRDGTIASILDKKNGNRELVDQTADAGFNQYRYYDDFGIPFRNMGVKFTRFQWKLYTPKEKDTIRKMIFTPLGITAEITTSTFRAGSIRQRVTLYDQIDRIDIANEVVKSPLPKLTDKEEAFYAFPFQASGCYHIRYDLPIGNTLEGEQVYGTSTDWYTANKYVSVYDKGDDYSMTLAMPDSALLEFGERRTGKWSFDYQSKKPYVFSYIFNNMWQTNFQGDQPGYASFRYSIRADKGEDIKAISKFAWGVSAPLQGAVIAGAQSGFADSRYFDISSENVILTTMKMAEVNGGGMIVRFAEIGGAEEKSVTVTLPDQIVSSVETDIIENNIAQEVAGNTITFSIPPYGLKTFRMYTAKKIGQIQNVHAASMDLPDSPARGTLVEWDTSDSALFYEVFRLRKDSGEENPRFIGAVQTNTFFDTQVYGGLCSRYSYFVRGCSTSEKGPLSQEATPRTIAAYDTLPPPSPVLHAVPREKTRIDLHWTPVRGSIPLRHYEIYRNAIKIAETKDPYVCTYRDKDVLYANTYRYTVRVVDVQGASSVSNEVMIAHSNTLFDSSNDSRATRRR